MDRIGWRVLGFGFVADAALMGAVLVSKHYVPPVQLDQLQLPPASPQTKEARSLELHLASSAAQMFFLPEFHLQIQRATASHLLLQ